MSGGRARRSLLSSIWGHLRSFEFECTTRQPPLHHRRFSGLTDAKHAPSRHFSSLVGRRDGGGVQIWEAGMYSRLHQGFLTSNKSITQVCVWSRSKISCIVFAVHLCWRKWVWKMESSWLWAKTSETLHNSVIKLLRNPFRSWLTVCVSCSLASVTLEW